jgi:hypothetical protein
MNNSHTYTAHLHYVSDFIIPLYSACNLRVLSKTQVINGSVNQTEKWLDTSLESKCMATKRFYSL